MRYKQTHRFIAFGVLALASTATAAQTPDQVGWSAQIIGKARDSGRAVVVRGDGELDSRHNKKATYRMHMSWRIEGHKKLVLLTRMEAIETGGDHTWLRLPTKRTVLYTAPAGMALVEADLSLPPMLQAQSNAAFATTGGQEITLTQWSINSRELCAMWGDRWGNDIMALRYMVQVSYRVRLANITYPSSGVQRQVHRPSRRRFNAPRRRYR